MTALKAPAADATFVPSCNKLQYRITCHFSVIVPTYLRVGIWVPATAFEERLHSQMALVSASRWRSPTAVGRPAPRQHPVHVQSSQWRWNSRSQRQPRTDHAGLWRHRAGNLQNHSTQHTAAGRPAAPDKCRRHLQQHVLGNRVGHFSFGTGVTTVRGWACVSVGSTTVIGAVVHRFGVLSWVGDALMCLKRHGAVWFGDGRGLLDAPVCSRERPLPELVGGPCQLLAAPGGSTGPAEPLTYTSIPLTFCPLTFIGQWAEPS